MFKYGCLPGRVPVGLRDLTWYVAGALPKPPPKVTAPTVNPWGMLGNDQYGDCGPVGLDHGYMAVASVLSRTEEWPTTEQIIAYYLNYTGGKDTGVVLADFLEYVRLHEFFGRTIQAYAPVSTQDIPTLQFAIFAYTFAYVGIHVTAAMEAKFQAGQPWTLEDLNSPILGGHCISLIGYDSDYLYCITWGKVQAIAYSAWHYIADEAWAVIPGEFQTDDGRGVNLAALQADLAKVGK